MWFYAGLSFHLFAAHIEDAALCACNLQLTSGWKLWIMFPPQSATELINNKHVPVSIIEPTVQTLVNSIPIGHENKGILNKPTF